MNHQNAHVCESCGNQAVYESTNYDRTNSKWSLAYAIFGWIFAFASFVFLPILFGLAAYILGFFTFTERSPLHGAAIMTVAALGTLVGSLFSFMVAGTMFF